MTKPRVHVAPDGRIGFPDVLQYRITEGPAKGELRAVPPTWQTDPYTGPHPYHKASVAFEVVIHDHAEYDRLRLKGFWTSKEHAGEMSVADNRGAPQG